MISIGVINVGIGLQSTLLGIRSSYEDFSILQTGLVMSSYFIGFIISTLFTANIINGVGHIRCFSAFASVASAATLCHAVFVDPISWFVLRAITGFCIGGLTMVGESWLNATSSNKNRGTIFSIYMIVVLGAAALSQALVNLGDVNGYDLFILVSVAMSVALVPVALGRKIIAPEIQESETMKFRKLWKNSPLGTVGVLISGLVNGALWTMTAVYATRIGMTPLQISWVMMLLIVGGIVSMWPVGKLSDRIDRRKVILALSAMSLAVSLFIAVSDMLFDDQIFYTALYVLMAIMGMAAFPMYAVAMAHTNDFLSEHEFVPGSSAMILLYSLGAIAAPLTTSLFMDMLGSGGMFYYIAAVNAALIPVAIVRIIQTDVVPEEERAEFVATMPKVSSAASPLDPRNHDAEDLAEEAFEENLEISTQD